MKKNNRHPWFIRILSLFFAILLYLNANTTPRSSRVTTQSRVFESVAANVPLVVTYDEDKYYVSGHPETVDVKLKSDNKILLDKESNSETRGFSVRADLSGMSEGTHDVQLETINLPNNMEATITPSRIQVTIEKKENNSFVVEPAIDKSIFATGYSLKSATVTPTTVKIEAGNDTLSRVARVIASVTDKQNVTEDFSQNVTLYAVDNEDQIMDVRINPTTARVDVSVQAPTKRVRINPVQSGTIPSGIREFQFELRDDIVEISGPQDVIDGIEAIELKIDTSNIRKTVSSSYPVPVPRSVTAKPETVLVTVTPVMDDTQTTSTSKKEEQTEQTKDATDSTDTSR
ncbi:CdaR family protein [Vagococcus acidifermentans]|uniref:YbbR-like protein n=1 Tax=Vagococcus acidifermentans TaxID=564710 RepID=A0A430AMJ5_9ENTE|nr:CdaR family protein [Vagococcus acidifermentans]RSU09319.1 hypothetical protein CBF27_12965 [Vagococcus acidifermentans]